MLNLRDRTAEVYEWPDVAAGTYPPPRVVAADGTLDLRVGDGEFFTVSWAHVPRNSGPGRGRRWRDDGQIGVRGGVGDPPPLGRVYPAAGRPI